MSLQYIRLPLFEDAFYSYSVALEDISYVVNIRYNERSEQWIMDLLSADSSPIATGVGIVPLYPIMLDYAITGMTGFFWLEPIAEMNNEQYKQFPEKLNQYYRMFYLYDNGE
jgi:hypothetical protein